MENFTFMDLPYSRPDCEALKKQMKEIVARAKKARDYVRLKAAFEEFEGLMASFSEAATVAGIRHTLDTTDSFWETENEWVEEQSPRVSAVMLSLVKVLLNKKWDKALREDYGDEFIEALNRRRSSFSPKIIRLTQKESKLCSRYEKLIASAKIPFEGGEHNLYGIKKYLEHEDRHVRKAAWDAYIGFFAANESELEEIFDRLIKIRHRMGRRMGFDNFVPLGYLQQERSDYGREEIESFREQVRTVLTPFCAELYEAQRRRLGIDQLMVWDEERVYPDGNADPIGTEEELVEKARKMYHELSPETAEFIDYMLDHRLMDLTNRPGKAATGYCATLPVLRAPFVFSCFNGTLGDIHVLTHELGHALAAYRATRRVKSVFLAHPGTDIAEIHSMSMEQFCYPWAESFFGGNAEKFRFTHLQNALTFVPFGVAVDEFQHICYDNPKLTPKQRTAEWRRLEEKYMPWRKYAADDDFANRGGWWYHKIHIFLYPMYYINYTLTTMGALEFGKRYAEDKESAWKDYLTLCDLGGSMSYLNLLRAANVSVPFEEGAVDRSTSLARETLKQALKKEGLWD
ncbi:MAG: M3 family oligoendopeptidase [Ruminococcaceae bacterium]|nr:M3 family oligoendopeptidase [Oscillospiraceae bacterium]